MVVIVTIGRVCGGRSSLCDLVVVVVIVIAVLMSRNLYRGDWGGPLKFEVGNDPCLRPPPFGKRYLENTLYTGKVYVPILKCLKEGHKEVWLEDVNFFYKKGNSEIWFKKIIDTLEK